MAGPASAPCNARGVRQLLMLAALLSACFFVASQANQVAGLSRTARALRVEGKSYARRRLTTDGTVYGLHNNFSCVSGQDASGNNIGDAFNVTDEAACMAACDGMEACTYYALAQFPSGLLCHLKRDYNNGPGGITGPNPVILSLCRKLVTCSSQPSSTANGTFACPTGMIMDDMCIASCAAGFVGTPSVTCQASGQWSAVTGSCIPDGTDYGGNSSYSCMKAQDVAGTEVTYLLGVDEAACRAACANTDACTFYAYVKGRICHLKRNYDGGPDGRTGPNQQVLSLCRKPDGIDYGGNSSYSCIKAQDVAGTEVSALDGMDEAACRAWCANTDTCTFYAYVKGRLCHLKRNYDNGPDGTTGPNQQVLSLCQKPDGTDYGGNSSYSCIKAQDVAGTEVSALDGMDEAACRAWCDNTDTCTFYAYVKGRLCHLKRNYDNGPDGRTGPDDRLLSLCRKPVPCTTQPANPANGNFACPPNAAVNAQCIATCTAGFTGSPSTTCQASGQWGVVTGSCTPVTCTSQPANLANANWQTCPTAISARCYATCDPGSMGNPSVTCQPSGQWSTVTGSCTLQVTAPPAAVCTSKPANLANANWQTCPNTINAKCYATCFSGYVGNPSVTCQPSGQWSTVTGSCTLRVTAPPTGPGSPPSSPGDKPLLIR